MEVWNPPDRLFMMASRVGTPARIEYRGILFHQAERGGSAF